jgi:hypothetical protein
MKKILCGIAFVLAMVLATSCGNFQKKNAVVEEVAEAVDSVAVEAPADSTVVAE